MPLNSKQRAHIKRLCSRLYREMDQMIKELEFNDWPEESKAEIKSYLENQKHQSDSVLKEMELPHSPH
jgi:uridine kinase